MSPIGDITVVKDTTLALLLAVQQKGWQLEYMETQDLWVNNGIAGANAKKIKVWDDEKKWFDLSPAKQTPLTEYDVIFMRLDPPVDSDYIYATQVLEMAENAGVLVVNPPAPLRDFNEKIFATYFPELMPPHLLSSNIADLTNFHQTNQTTVFKPLNAMGGKGIFMIKQGDLNLRSVLEGLTEGGKHLIMAQEYVPDIIEGGDKRVFLFDGVPYPKMVVRIPQSNDFRANLAAGGSYLIKDTGKEELRICEKVAPIMKENSLYFVGLDIIGGFLTEINITCPTGMREAAAKTKENPAEFFIDLIAEKL